MKSVSGFERVAAMFEPGKTSPGNMKGHRELGMHHVYKCKFNYARRQRVKFKGV